MTNDAPVIEGRSASSAAGNVLRGLAVVLVVLVFAALHYLDLLHNALFLVLLMAVPTAVLLKIWGAIRKKLALGLVRRPFAPETRWHLLQWFNRCLFWFLLALMLDLAVIPIQFEPDEYRVIRVILWGAVAALGLLELFPGKRVSLWRNLPFSFGWLFFGTQLVQVLVSVPADQCVVLSAPFRGEWYVFHGGRSALLNHHYLIPEQRHALDLCKLNDGRTSHGDATKLDSYAAYGQDLFAPADGKVVKVVSDRADEAIGGSDAENPVGNHVVIEVGPEKFVLLAHLMKASVVVREGDPVRRGDKLARCGNSGNTSEPHLHLQVQNRSNFDAPGLRTYAMLFNNVRRTRSGRTELLARADLRRNDRVVPAEENQ